jgi:hypothetical protein
MTTYLGVPPRGADQHAVGRATLDLLRTVAGSQPLLLAVDDLHWLELVGRIEASADGGPSTWRMAPRWVEMSTVSR